MTNQSKLEEQIIEKLYKDKPENIGIYTYILREENKAKIVDQILEVYKKIDPEHANLESAFKMFTVIHKIALKNKNKDK